MGPSIFTLWNGFKEGLHKGMSTSQTCERDLVWRKCLCRHNWVKNPEMRPCWMIQVGPKSNDKCACKRHKEERHMKKKRKPCGDGSRNCHVTARAKECLEPRSWKVQGRILSWKLPREHQALPTPWSWTLDIWRGSISPKFDVIFYSSSRKLIPLASFSRTNYTLTIQKAMPYYDQAAKFGLKSCALSLPNWSYPSNLINQSINTLYIY